MSEQRNTWTQSGTRPRSGCHSPTASRSWNSFPLGVGALPSVFKEPYAHWPRPSQTEPGVARRRARSAPSSKSGLSQPPAQRAVHRLVTDDRRGRLAPRYGDHGDGLHLRPAEASV